MPKGCQNDDKMDAKIYVFAYFFNKGENARNYCIYKRKLGSGHLKMHDKSKQNLYKIDARKRHAKSMENDANTDSKGHQNLSKILQEAVLVAVIGYMGPKCSQCIKMRV